MSATEPRDHRSPGADVASLPRSYEPPAVVEVLRAEDLRREVQYAGGVGSGPPG